MARRKITRIVLVRFIGWQFLLLPICSFGQKISENDSTSKWVRLDEVEVNALALANSKFEYGGMIGTIDSKKLSLSDPTIVVQSMNAIPGVYWHSGTLNTNRITIRGIGSRSPFSTNKIRAYYEDIPLTDGGGETTLEDIDLSFVGEVEVQKGANSSLYGSGLGGTIFLKKRSGDKEVLSLNSSFGSFGLFRAGLNSSIIAGNKSIQVGYQFQKNVGFRKNNSSDRQTFFSSLSFDLKKSKLNFLGLVLRQKAFIPSSLGATDFAENPTEAAFTWGLAQGFEDYDRWLAGFSWEQKSGKTSRIISSLYVIGRDAYEPRPFNILSEKKSGFGVRSRWEKIVEKWSFNAGIEWFADTYKSQTFENLYQNNGGEGSLQGLMLSSVWQPRNYINLFVESRYYLGENTILNTGVNVNRIQYRVERNLPDPLTSKKSFDLITSPRVSITHSLNEEINIFTTVSHGFSPPSIDDSSNPDGSLNENIKPEIGWNREFGIKRIGSKINVELAFYSMDIKDLLVTRRTGEDVVFGVNAGRTLHNGLEINLEALTIDADNTQVITSFSYSLSDFSFKDFINDSDNFSGNELTGVPKNQLNLSLRQETRWLFSGLSYSFVDQIPITDDNSIFSEKYYLVNAYAGAKSSIGKKWIWQFILRANNIFDEKYASMLSINAGAFGSNEPRYYYPGLPVNFQANISLSYKL